MFKAGIVAFAITGAFIGPASALNGKAFEGTWVGQTSNGAAIVLSIPAGIASGEPASYSYGNQDQGPQTPTVMGNKIRLNNPADGNYMLIGPVKGNHLQYFWTNGTNKANTVLTKQ